MKPLEQLKAERKIANDAVPFEAHEDAIHDFYDAVTRWLDALDENEEEFDAAYEARDNALHALIEANYQFTKAVSVWAKLHDQIEKRERPELLTKPPRGGWLRDRKPLGNA